jgi:hypothetical protein
MMPGMGAMSRKADDAAADLKRIVVVLEQLLETNRAILAHLDQPAAATP